MPCKYFHTYTTYDGTELQSCSGHNHDRVQCNGESSKCQFCLAESDECSFISDKHLGDHIWMGLWLLLPVAPWFNSKTQQVYWGNIFDRMRRTGTTFGELKKMVDGYVRSRNLIFGNTCSNTNCFLTREDKRFPFHISKDEFHIWDETDHSLGAMPIKLDEVPSKEFIEWMDTVTTAYCEGRTFCSDCGKSMRREEVAGSYFAGVYCKDCWEHRGWKEREAKETYN